MLQIYIVCTCAKYFCPNENFLYIIYARYSEDMCAKYGRSRMNDAHTISLADFVGCPAKVVRSTAFFLDSESIFV